MWAEAGLALSCALLIANALFPTPQVWMLFVGAAVSAGANAVHRPAIESLTPQLVSPEQMPAVAALSTFRFGFTFIVGPALAGLIAERFGAATAYGIDLATYAVSIATLFAIRSVPVPKGAAPASLRGIADGLRYARSRPELMGTYLIDINAMFFGMPIALFPAIAAGFDGVSVGLFYAMLAVGPLLVTLTSGWTHRVQRHGLGITWAVVIWGLAIVGFGLSHNLWVALGFLAIAGAADCVSGLFRMTMWNQTIPDRLRGRLAGVEMVSYLSGPYLGNAEAGLVASAFGLRTSIVSGGVLCVVGAGVVALLLPKFIRYDSRHGIALKNTEEAAAAQPS